MVMENQIVTTREREAIIVYVGDIILRVGFDTERMPEKWWQKRQ